VNHIHYLIGKVCYTDKRSTFVQWRRLAVAWGCGLGMRLTVVWGCGLGMRLAVAWGCGLGMRLAVAWEWANSLWHRPIYRRTVMLGVFWGTPQGTSGLHSRCGAGGMLPGWARTWCLQNARLICFPARRAILGWHPWAKGGEDKERGGKAGGRNVVYLYNVGFASLRYR